MARFACAYSHKRMTHNGCDWPVSNTWPIWVTIERVLLPALPVAPGVYVLHLSLAHSHAIAVGSLGEQYLSVGNYFYVGSACGAGGLRSRVERHLRGDGRPHWHIDYLRAVAQIRNALYTVADTPFECRWSQALAQLPQAVIPVPHFGAGDCRSGCRAHLIAMPHRSDIARVQLALQEITPSPIESLAPVVR
jgi:Uri superfamily endonuclease